MKIRLMGTAEECRVAAIQIGTVLEVLEQSDPYPNRPPSKLWRMYLEVDCPTIERDLPAATTQRRPPR